MARRERLPSPVRESRGFIRTQPDATFAPFLGKR